MNKRSAASRKAWRTRKRMAQARNLVNEFVDEFRPETMIGYMTNNTSTNSTMARLYDARIAQPLAQRPTALVTSMTEREFWYFFWVAAIRCPFQTMPLLTAIHMSIWASLVFVLARYLGINITA